MDAEDWYRYGEALRKTDVPGEALEVSRRLYRQNEDIPQVRVLYAWCIYDIAVSVEPERIEADEDRFRRGVEAILELTGDRTAHSFSPRVHAVFRMIRYLEEFRQDAAAEVLEWVHRLNPDELSDQVGYWRQEEGEVVELSSDREKWFSAYTKALFALERHQECLDACEEAMRRIPEFAGTNRIWFRRRRALCNAALGFRESAIEELRELLEIEERWFIYYELARLFRKEEQFDRSLRYAAAAALCGEVEPYRWKLFSFMAVVAGVTSHEERAPVHAELALALRERAGWSMAPAHKKLAGRFDIDMDRLREPGRLIDELRPWWEESTLEP
jgi:tetratricopeptide (TPR) repeat protein